MRTNQVSRLAVGQVVIRRQLKRRLVLSFFEKLPPCLVGIEACASSHHWSRELQALGHTVRLMPLAYVKPYVKRQKNKQRGRGGDLRSGNETQHAVVPTAHCCSSPAPRNASTKWSRWSESMKG